MADDAESCWETVKKRRPKKPKPQPIALDPPIPIVNYIPPPPITTPPQPPPPPPFLLLLIGLPGSGKSTFATLLQTAKPYKYTRINQDTLGDRQSCEHLTRQILLNNNHNQNQHTMIPVVDRCHITIHQRKIFFDIAKDCGNVPVDGIIFDYDVEVCIRRCSSRGRTNHATIHPSEARGVIGRMAKDFCIPGDGTTMERFRRLVRVTDVKMVREVLLEYLGDGY